MSRQGIPTRNGRSCRQSTHLRRTFTPSTAHGTSLLTPPPSPYRKRRQTRCRTTLPSTGIHSGLRSCTICSGSKPGKRRLRERPKKKRCRNSATLFANVLSSGKKGIRTPETLLRFTRFPGGPVQPLLHLSVGMAQKYAIFPDSANDGDFFCTVPPGTDSVQTRKKSQAPA